MAFRLYWKQAGDRQNMIIRYQAFETVGNDSYHKYERL